ncbi:MAG: ATP-binding protein, partial [Candidatus Anstonellaceae archaeon]
MMDFKTTAEIKIPPRLVDQVIGQDKAVDIIKKAAKQKRHVLMIGPPGTGKSMLAQAMAELMPAEELEDVLVYPNPNDENKPLIRVVPTYPNEEQIRKDPELSMIYSQIKKFAFLKQQRFENLPGAGRLIYQSAKNASNMLINKPQQKSSYTNLLFLLGLMLILIVMYTFGYLNDQNKWFVLAALGGFAIFYLLWRFTNTISKRMGFMVEHNEPKLIIDNTGRYTAPFIDATGNKAGALLGDVKHDPLQSGGLGTPPHLRVEGGAIHKAHKGVLFIDEIASLKMRWQQEILTAMQEKKYSITGQSELSSGAIVKTEPVPCDFVLIAAGNYMDLRYMHPAIRSRIRGAGYEVYMEETMEDNEENENKLVQFVAQEVVKDKKIPHFDRAAVEEVIAEARRKAGRKKRFTLNLRELGGLVRAAGDIAREENAPLVTAEHVRKAKTLALTMEQQMASKYIEVKKEYEVFTTTGYEIGK